MRYLHTILFLGFLFAMWTTRNLSGTGGWLCFLFATAMWGFLALALCEWTTYLERYL